jgi:hypothetical protein
VAGNGYALLEIAYALEGVLVSSTTCGLERLGAVDAGEREKACHGQECQVRVRSTDRHYAR